MNEAMLRAIDDTDDQIAPVPLSTHKTPPLTVELFTGWFGDMVKATSISTETPLELAAMMGLAGLATCCHKKFSVRPEAGYFEPVNLWVVSAMDSGNRKSAVLQAMAAPLIAWEREQTEKTAKRIVEMEADRKTKELRIQHLRGRIAKEENVNLEAAKKELAALEADLPEIPTIPRLWTQDVTPEKLGQLMADHDEKMSILSDEGGIFDIMAGRYNGGVPNLDVFLQAHAGTSVRVDRGTRKAVFMHHPALTIGLSPQPEVLRALDNKPGFRGRGLIARFLYTLPESKLGYRVLRANPIPESVSDAYETGIRSLLDLHPTLDTDGNPRPHVLSFSTDAWREWKEFQRIVESDMREGGRFEHIQDWASKLPGAMARVAGLLHCAENANPHVTEIASDTMKRTLALGALLCEHALAVFDAMSADPAMSKARRVWRWVEQQRTASFTLRDCWHPLRGTFKRVKDIEPALEILVERRYLFRTELDERRPGRPTSQTFTVNPVLTEDWQ